jgi:hypothetical protein
MGKLPVLICLTLKIFVELLTNGGITASKRCILAAHFGCLHLCLVALSAGYCNNTFNLPTVEVSAGANDGAPVRAPERVVPARRLSIGLSLISDSSPTYIAIQ